MTISLNRISSSLQNAVPELTETVELIRIGGTVQGVGFRPTVYRLACQWGLRGEVWNDGAGVVIRAAGTAADLEGFVQQLQAECPLLAQITEIVRTPITEPVALQDFQIRESISTAVSTAVAADAATCPACLADTLDPFSRWYRYPFTNCTHCGPRLSIIRTIPYDRQHTSLAAFPLCADCAQVYHDVNDRRFHAQPVACHKCGPHAWLERADGKAIVADMFSMMDDVDAACTLIQRGEIVAIKGIGGIHLACDATNEAAVQKLRQRKRRYDKPFALMARDLDIIAQYCEVSPVERDLLQSPAAPIVLLKAKNAANAGADSGADSGAELAGSGSAGFGPTGFGLAGFGPAGFGPAGLRTALAPSVAPGLSQFGFMLPYSPLHHLMLRRMKRPIVLTSGNLSDEPQCISNAEAQEKLDTIADFLLLHNREIVNRVDDSVVRVVQGQPQILRRARGYAPAPLPLPAGFEAAPDLLAMGSELKNTFCLLSQGKAILSQHLGDLENGATLAAYQDSLKLYLDLFQHQPQQIAVDQHPEYLSTKLGQELAEAQNLPLQSVQHHHAHIAACLAENGVPLQTLPVLGIALDGLGFGQDGTLWGGEFLLANYAQFQRLARLEPTAMLGGSQAIYQPWRNTYAQLARFDWQALQADYGDLEILQFLDQQPRALLDQMLQQGLNSPLASSAGRLFDAVAAALDLHRAKVSYEGQAAIQLEALIQPADLAMAQDSAYPFHIQTSQQNNQQNDRPLLQLSSRPLWPALLQDLHQAVPVGLISARFHLGLAQAIGQLVQQLRQTHSFTQVALTGGVFQNQILTEAVQAQLSALNLTVLTHHLVPPNDGGLALGQATIAAARLL
jgi:hydrogenase maturation protein HypF